MEDKKTHDIKKELMTGDQKLRLFFKTKMPQAPQSPWFTRTILNRMPDRKKKRAATIEIYICVFALIITIIFGVSFVIKSLNAPMITVGDIIVYAGYLILQAGLIYNIFTPWIYRRVNV